MFAVLHWWPDLKHVMLTGCHKTIHKRRGGGGGGRKADHDFIVTGWFLPPLAYKMKLKKSQQWTNSSISLLVSSQVSPRPRCSGLYYFNAHVLTVYFIVNGEVTFRSDCILPMNMGEYVFGTDARQDITRGVTVNHVPRQIASESCTPCYTQTPIISTVHIHVIIINYSRLLSTFFLLLF